MIHKETKILKLPKYAGHASVKRYRVPKIERPSAHDQCYAPVVFFFIFFIFLFYFIFFFLVKVTLYSVYVYRTGKGLSVRGLPMFLPRFNSGCSIIQNNPK